MQFVIDGQRLELPAGFDLQFTKKNPLFAFDNLECERSTSFDVPATPHNDQIFGLAKLPAAYGAGMRKKYAAQLQGSAVVKNGDLYVTAYEGGKYKCVFVTGELLGLQAIRNAGSVRDLLQYDQKLTWNDSDAVPCNSQTPLPDLGFVQYMHAGAHINPSVSLRWLMEEAADTLGVQITFARTAANDRKRLFSTRAEYEINETRVHIKNDPDASQDVVNLSSFLGLVSFVPVAAATWNVTAYAEAGGLEWDYENATLVGTDQFDQIALPYDVVLEFPDDTPENLCIVTGSLNMTTGGHAVEECNFLGTRRFGASGIYSGLPLAGQRVTIPANTPFMLTDAAGVVWTDPQTVGQQGVVGFNAALVPAYDVAVKITIDHKWAYGEDVPYNAILPDLSLVDLLKIYAAIYGLVLSYSDAAGVTFESIAPADFDQHEIAAALSVGTLERKFGDYAQRNLVRFDSNDGVPVGERLQTVYLVENATIEAEKDLAVLPVSEGGVSAAMGIDRPMYFVYIRTAEAEGEKQTIGNADTGAANMQRVTLPKNEGLQVLCDASTALTLQARLSLLQFDALSDKTAIYYAGTPYVWTEAQWSKDVATLKLSKTIAPHVTPLSPYSPEATEILIADFPTYWPEIRQYGYDNPQYVAYINEDPHLICSLMNIVYLRYLSGDGVAYIDTGIVPDNGSIITCRFRLTDANAYGIITGSRAGANNRAFTIQRTAAGRFVISYNGQTHDFAQADTNEHFVNVARWAIFDNDSFVFSYSSFTTPGTAAVLGFDNNETKLGCKCMIRTFGIEKVYGVRDLTFRPFICQARTADQVSTGVAQPAGTCGFIALETGIFYPNANTSGSLSIVEIPM